MSGCSGKTCIKQLKFQVQLTKRMQSMLHHLKNIVIYFQIDKKAMHKVGMVQRVQNEVKIHCQLKHPSILEVRFMYF